MNYDYLIIRIRYLIRQVSQRFVKLCSPENGVFDPVGEVGRAFYVCQVFLGYTRFEKIFKQCVVFFAVNFYKKIPKANDIT